MKQPFKQSAHFAHLLTLRAGAMRAQPTPSEQALWQALSGRRLSVSFGRQVPVAGFIADFCAPAARLIVEVDGSWHADRGRLDARRDRRLMQLGLKVLHLPAELVLSNLPEAVRRIREALAG